MGLCNHMVRVTTGEARAAWQVTSFKIATQGAELCPKVDGAVKSRFILGSGPSILGHDYIARQKDR